MTPAQYRRRWYGLLCVLVGLLVGSAGVLVIGRTAPTQWLVFGGNTDPGDGQGGGLARDQLAAGGWADAANIYQVTWTADISQGTARITDDTMAAAEAAYAEHCGHGCIVAGFSLGTAPATELANRTGHPASSVYLFGGPYTATGIFHTRAADHPLIEPWVTSFGGMDTDRRPPTGVHALFDGRDPYANAAPQCYGPGLFTLTLDGHRIITRAEASQHVWTGPDGTINHEAGYVPGGLPRSGSDPAGPLDGCPDGRWSSDHDTAANPGPVPGVPGTPDTASLPTAVPTGG